jgi:F0F1-type ATP synthase epsilon subunit
MSLNVCVITPDRVVWDVKVDEIIFFSSIG